VPKLLGFVPQRQPTLSLSGIKLFSARSGCLKSEGAYKAGRTINIRAATLKEIEKHQALMLKNNRGLMKDIEKRKIIVLRLHQNGMYFGQRMQ